MVNRGASQGCLTCRQRRVKCDQGKPRCRQCLRLGRDCAGYGKASPRVRFRDETSRYFGTMPDNRTRAGFGSQAPTAMKMMTTTTPTTAEESSSPSNYDNAILRSPSPIHQDLAVSFFLTYAADFGRSLDSTRGFMEIVRPVLAAERHDSALSVAVNAVAAKVWAMLGASNCSTSPPSQLLSQAVTRLHKAVKDPRERGRDATVLTALVLQLYETFSAVSSQHQAHGTHRDGASALLLHRDGDSAGSKFHRSLLGNMFHSKVSMCVRGKRPFLDDEMKWYQTEVIPNLPVNASSTLDIIGVPLANLQYAVCKLSRHQKHLSSSTLEAWSRRVQNIDIQLGMWLQTLPQHWFPTTIKSGEDLDPSVISYQGTCDVYPSVQVASLWNVWHTYRLILVQIKLQLACSFLATRKDMDYAEPDADCEDEALDSSQHIQEAQEVIDAICRSVPFYMGNRVDSAGVNDMENPRLIFPSYHDLPPSNERFLRYEQSDFYLTKRNHTRHAVLQGPWRIMSILAHLIGMIEGECNILVASFLGQRQKDWVSRQFLRSLHIQRLLAIDSSVDISTFKTVQSQEAAPEIPRVNDLAARIREGLWTMNIL